MLVQQHVSLRQLYRWQHINTGMDYGYWQMCLNPSCKLRTSCFNKYTLGSEYWISLVLERSVVCWLSNGPLFMGWPEYWFGIQVIIWILGQYLSGPTNPPWQWLLNYKIYKSLVIRWFYWSGIRIPIKVKFKFLN